jgi:hypothetical protein
MFKEGSIIMHRNLKAFKEIYTSKDIRQYLKEKKFNNFGYLFGQESPIQGILNYPKNMKN